MKNIVILSFLSCLLTTTAFAFRCPPEKLVEEKVKSFHSAFKYGDFKFHVNHSDFESSPYHFQNATLVGAELSAWDKVLGGNVISCHYKVFDKKAGEIVLESNSTFPKTVKPEGNWVLEEGTYSCDAKKDKNSEKCSFDLIDKEGSNLSNLSNNKIENKPK